MMTLAGKNVAITGASQGLGLAIAEKCLQEGANVAICARTESDLGRARESLAASAQGAKIVTVVADMSREEDVEEVDVEKLRDMVDVKDDLADLDVYVTGQKAQGTRK